MKKTLVALSVLAAAANVNAAEIYSAEGSSVSLKGEIDVLAKQSEVDQANDMFTPTSKTTTKEDPAISTWAKIQLDAEHKVNANWTAFGSFEIQTADYGDSNAEFDDVLAGLKSDSLSIAFGEVADLAESMDAIQKDDIGNEGNYMGSTGGHHKESEGVGAVVQSQLTDELTLVFDVHTDKTEDVDNTYGLSLDYSTDMFSVGAAYVTGDAAEDIDYMVGGVSASVTYEGLMVAATYAQFEGNYKFGFWKYQNDDKTVTEYYNGDVMGLALAYSVDKVRLYSTYAMYTVDEEQVVNNSVSLPDELDGSNLLVGIDYAFMDNVLLFAEYETGSQEITKDLELDADTVKAGFYYSF